MLHAKTVTLLMHLLSILLCRSTTTLSIFCDLLVHSDIELIEVNTYNLLKLSLLFNMLPNAGTAYDADVVVDTGMILTVSSMCKLMPSLIFSEILIFRTVKYT